MSESFELMQHPFHHRLNQLGSSQQPHVAQQIRRDKLRIAQHISGSSSSSPSAGIPNFVLQSQEVEESRNSGLSRSEFSGLPGIGGLMPLHDPNGMISSEMINFQASADYPPVKESIIQSLNSQANTDYIVNCFPSQGTQNPVVGSMVLGSVGAGFPLYNPDAQSSLSVVNEGEGDGHSKSFTELPLAFLQQNPVHQPQLLSQIPQEIRIREHSQGLLVPSFGNLQSGQSDFNELSHRHGDLRAQQWGGGCFVGGDDANHGGFKTDSTGQGLSLSLSFHNPPELHLQQYEARFGNQSLAPTAASVYSINRHEKQKQDHCVGSFGDYGSFQKDGAGLMYGPSVSGIQKNPVPLGPFTGYASVLKNSKFLKPAQQLLDEFCNVGKVKVAGGGGLGDGGGAGSLQSSKGQRVEIDGSCGGSGVSCDAPAAGVVNPPCISSTSSVYGSAAGRPETGHDNPISSVADRNEHRKKKTRLVSMLEEVFRRYRHYYRQLQMVVTSFESVAGLSNAAPYTSMALKSMSKHFRYLKNAINDQLKFTCKLLGEDCFSPGPAVRDEISGLRLEAQQRGGGEGSSVVEPHPQHHVWRPQRGLPERAVTVLRTWLFEHFLHPYPTDTDKQMLAKQTGLTRNQVSNWFINARVRLWKPLVEEIHMLETRDSSSSMDLNSVRKPDSVPATDGSNGRNQQGQLNLHSSAKPPTENLAYADHGNGSSNLQSLGQPMKRSRADGLPIISGTGGDGAGNREGVGSIGDPYQHSNEVFSNVTRVRSGVGGVSLTLGLHHNGVCLPSSHHETMHGFAIEDDHSNNLNAGGNTKRPDKGERGGNAYSMSGFEGQRDQIRKNLSGQLLHDFVG